MPGAAHDRDALEAFLHSGTNRPAHVRLALLLPEASVAGLLPQSGHGFQQCGEEANRVEPLLDLLLPPFLRILVPGGARERFQWIGPRQVVWLFRGEPDRLRQIHEARWHAATRC